MALKGIILAGGSGTRLYPMSLVISKQLLPVYDKPMIYYPLAVLLTAGVKDIAIISTPEDLPKFHALLGDGHNYGISLTYLAQPVPNGIAQAFVIARDFLGDDDVILILGDNLFLGQNFTTSLMQAVGDLQKGLATIFGCRVKDPERFGVMKFHAGKPVDIIEKPESFVSDIVVPGLYLYPAGVSKVAMSLQPSKRHEYEITDISRFYLQKNRLSLRLLDESCTWIDMGTPESLLKATDFIREYETAHKKRIACIEEIVWRNGWISRDTLLEHAEFLAGSSYGAYLRRIAEE